MANAGCINAYDCNGCLIQTLQNLDSACIGVGVQYTAPNPLDDKRLDYIKYTDKCGCVQCLSAENEILIYATNGVIKNLTLTNDDVNEAIKIQWNDIFGSNRAKTVVRYKTGSYPVSITDGTLAVEETTKNQYSSTPFSLSGVLDETTYYITAFAVDSNNVVIGTQQTTITTDFGWHPSANTLLYMPLNGNVKDEVSGSYGTQGGTVSYETLSSGLKVFHKVSGNYILTPSITMNTEMTVVGWLYWISGDLFFRADSSSTPRSFYQISVGGTNQGGGYRWNNGTAYGTSSGIGKNGWYHCVLVCGSGGVKIYVNGTQVYSNATTSFSWRSQKRGVGYDQSNSSSVNAQGYYSHLIIEKKQWTLNDVLKDYNNTKNLYGIS